MIAEKSLFLLQQSCGIQCSGDSLLVREKGVATRELGEVFRLTVEPILIVCTNIMASEWHCRGCWNCRRSRRGQVVRRTVRKWTSGPSTFA